MKCLKGVANKAESACVKVLGWFGSCGGVMAFALRSPVLRGITLWCPLILIVPGSAFAARSVYVNGTDVSSARNQVMEGVTVRIDSDGNVFVDAPHYQVNEESTYIPLRRHANEARPEHRQGASLPAELRKMGVLPAGRPSDGSVDSGTVVGPIGPADSELPAKGPIEGSLVPKEAQNAPEGETPDGIIAKGGSKTPGK